ncbi:MAG TPA: hypothetical protein VFF69_07185 [Phycisphaerales bacterium]|nr:hypothetical protein [Phycisphaerales bacterium]
MGTLASGCADLESARAFRADAAHLHQALEADASRWESEASGLPPEDPALPSVQSRAAAARAREQALAAALARIDEVIAEAENPTDPISQTVDAASPLLPVSVRGPLLLGAAALVAGVRAWRLKSGLASVARGLATAMREDEEFRACFARHANTFRSTQTPTAKRIVDEVTGSKRLVALPV